ncbi:MAG: recombinase family protein [Erysipelotrichaceae bacterium]|nr:recombinase family protein [Erysipelotrichaceae bacterium]
MAFFASLAEFERETIRQRQAEGIAIAKANGVYKGRVRKDINRNKFLSLYNKWQSKGSIWLL